MEIISGYLKLLLASLLVALTVTIVYLAEKKTNFAKLKYWQRQSIIGLIFGLLAVIATEFGVPLDGAILNVRDASPLCAGLIFGAPAGIIAGLIGGVERFFAVYWGAGEYTRLACSISTVLAGVLAAALRKHLFDNKKPTWFYGLSTGLVMEVLHMLMIFITNMNDVRGAFHFVKQCAGTMILFNGLTVMLAVMIVTLISREPISIIKNKKKISQAFQRWLLLCVTVAFLLTCLFTVSLQTKLSSRDTERLLAINLKDVRKDINDASDENLLKLNREIAQKIESYIEVNGTDSIKNLDTLITKLADEYSIAEIDIIDKQGKISHCTNLDFVGFDMASGSQSSEFLVLLDKQKELVQSYQPISYDKSVSRKYAGVALSFGGFVQVAYDANNFHKDIANTVIGVTRNRHVGENGCMIICDESWQIVSDRNGYEGQNLVATGIWIDKEKMPENVCFDSVVYNEESICMYTISEGYTIIATMPKSDAVFTRDVSVYIMAFMEIIMFAVLFTVIYFLIKRLVVNNILEINQSLAKITSGNLDVKVEVRSNEEFASLSDDINSTIITLKRYIAEAAARIDQELEFARTIQNAALPSVFPERKEFDLFASMNAAKEVGGDFYDFYFIDDNHLALLIADVSGKGIPAAMFMMTSKTLVKTLAESGLEASEVLTLANNELCSGNKAGMFVTMWFGILNIETGKILYSNAGHNPPLLKHKDGQYNYIKSKVNLVLAGMDGIKYKINELELVPGDTLFLYTDGVTEATNLKNELYGEARLKTTLDSCSNINVEELTKTIRNDIDVFAGEAPQFDDITMLALCYQGKKNEAN